MNEQAILKLKKSFGQCVEISVQEKKMLQKPPIVESTLKPAFINRIIGLPLIQGSTRWKPSIQTPRIEYIIPATENVELLGGNISYSNLNFPDSCCKCLDTSSHFELVELLSKEIGGKTRTWFAIPFCEEHKLESNAITIDIKGQIKEKVILHFTNIEYGRLFGEQNSFTAYLLTAKTMKSRVYAPVAIFFAVAMFSFGILFLYDNLVGFDARLEKGMASITSLPISLSVFIIGVVFSIWSISFWIKHRKGEKL